MSEHDPTPEERADYIVKRLELFIRENREPFKGMRFREWQDMARAEIANSLRDAEKRDRNEDQVSRRFLFVFGSVMATIGFWGTAAAFGRLDYMLAGMICLIAGIIIIAHVGEWTGRRIYKKHESQQRKRAYERAVTLDQQIKKMEKDLKSKADDLEFAITKVRAVTEKDD